MSTRYGSVLACAAILAFAGCGGGDDPAPPPDPPAQPPPMAPAAPGALSYASPATATLGTAFSSLPTLTGTATTWSVSPALPAGLTLNASSGAITGTPTQLRATTSHTITAANAAGSTTFALSLKVDPAASTPYTQSNLVSNGAVPGTRVDARLVNPWGLAFSATSASWVGNNVTQTSTLYDGTGTPLALVVNIPPGVNGPANPTGVVAYAGSEFTVSANGVTAPARFIFAGEGGTISGWAPTVNATNAVTVHDDGAGMALYTGLAVATNGTAATLYAADFRNGKIDVFNGAFQEITAPGGFTDPQLPAGYAPYNIQALSLDSTTRLVVTYASRNPAGTDSVPGDGLGLVDVYDLDGRLVRRLVSPGGRLNAPWGLALAPQGFGFLGGMLLVGNFGDGVINGFDPVTGVFAGRVADANGTPFVNAGLWGLAFGNGSQNQPQNTLYLTAGLAGELAGLYARIDAGATAPDVVAPTVLLTAPAAGNVAGSVNVTADANDDRGVARVIFSVRVGTTTTVIGTDESAPWSVTLDTSTLANGAATLTAQAVDAASNATTSAAVNVTIANVAAPAPTLAQLQTDIFTPRCSGCHNGAGPGLPGVMNLTGAASTHAALVGVASLQVPAVPRVAAANPAGSYLVQKLEGTQTVGQRMPFGGPFLSAAEIDRVKAWIQAGAAP